MKSQAAFASLGICFSLLCSAQAESPDEKRERHYLSGVEVMTESQGLTELQASGIRSYLDEERMMIELFTHYSLLDDQAMQAKIREILDVTQVRIGLALTPGQLDCWKDWTSRLNRRPVRRVHVD